MHHIGRLNPVLRLCVNLSHISVETTSSWQGRSTRSVLWADYPMQVPQVRGVVNMAWVLKYIRSMQWVAKFSHFLMPNLLLFGPFDHYFSSLIFFDPSLYIPPVRSIIDHDSMTMHQPRLPLGSFNQIRQRSSRRSGGLCRTAASWCRESRGRIRPSAASAMKRCHICFLVSKYGGWWWLTVVHCMLWHVSRILMNSIGRP